MKKINTLFKKNSLGLFIKMRFNQFVPTNIDHIPPFSPIFFSVASGQTSPLIGAHINKKKSQPRRCSDFHFYNLHNPLIISPTHPSPHFQIFKLTHFQINFHIPKFPHLHIPSIFKLSHFQINTLSHS